MLINKMMSKMLKRKSLGNKLAAKMRMILMIESNLNYKNN